MQRGEVNLAGKDLNLLFALHALLEEGNVTRAGARMGVGQSTMSATLARLRLHYHDELLVRVGRDFQLTPLARALLPEVQSAVPLVQRALGGEVSFDPSSAVRRFSIVGSDSSCLEVQERLLDVPDAQAVAIDFVGPAHAPSDVRHELLEHDFVLAEPGVGIGGEYSILSIDRYVGILDARNPAVVDGTLSWEAFRALPRAAANLGAFFNRSAERRLRELGVQREPAVQTHGFVSLPRVVTGTSLVAVMPARMAARTVTATDVVVVELPFGPVEAVEALWWHPSKVSDPGHRWLRDAILRSAALQHPSVAAG